MYFTNKTFTKVKTIAIQFRIISQDKVIIIFLNFFRRINIYKLRLMKS